MRFLKAAETFLAKNEPLSPFHPFPAASQREAYETLPSRLSQKVISLGESYLGYPYPSIHATDFMAFTRTGNRVDYEDIYFARRYALNSLVAAECVEYQGRFLDDIINGIFVLCEESAWQLPPHNSYDNQIKEILPDSTRPILDLFACETGAQLACIAYLLQEKLDSVSPYITKRIESELQQRIITPYLKEHFWWMGRGEEPMCNWTPWCTQNVLFAYFLSRRPQRSNLHTPPVTTSAETANNSQECDFSQNKLSDNIINETGRAIVRKAAQSCDYFLKDYGDDGCCDEGAQYYRHAGLCLDGAANVLNQITGGAFSDLMHWKKIQNIASYIFHVHVDDKYYFNFADCSPIAGRAGIREYLFGKHTNQPELMQFAAEDFRTSEELMFADESHQLNLFYRMQAIFCYEEIMAYDSTAPLHYRDTFYPSVGLFLTRNQTFTLAVKAGDNNDSHNHNDVGSLTLYKNGKPVLVDIGVESYTKKTFSPDRYTIWTMQSGYHNLPTLEGTDQLAGAEYRAECVCTSMDQDEKSSISMELSGAYSLPSQGHHYRRNVVLDKKANCITLTDHTDIQNVILNFITYEKPLAEGNTVKLGAAGFAFSGAVLTAIETLPITDKRLQIAWDHDLYRIRLKMEGPEFQMTIS